MDFGALFQQWKDATGVLQKVIAARAGMKENKLSAIAVGKNRNPTLDTLERIARGFGVPLAEFLAGPPTKVSGASQLPSAAPREAAPTAREHPLPVGGDHDATQTDALAIAVADIKAASAEIRYAVSALNAVTARAALADARRETAATRARRPRSGKGPRKHR